MPRASAAGDEEQALDGDGRGGHGQAGRQRVQGAKRMREQVDDEEEPVSHRDSNKQKKKFSTIPDPKKQKDKVSQGLQQDMRLGNDDAFYASCRNTTQDYVRRANVSPTLTWNKWSPSKKALVIQGVEGKIPYMRRMEDHWAVIALAQQYLKNHRQGLRKKGELEADERYAHCGANALMRGSGNRTKKVKLARQEQERRRLEDEDAAIGAPVRKRARVERARPEFEQGSSRDGERGVADEDENDEDYDSSSAHPQRDRRYRPEEDDEQGSD
ncbi:hypothetical protein MKEN_00901900 [Mycena kentingensis (nom. inval.)]|nr:hypothetical protein MKEN_00901900 [Mycena kentingensis (nom. inval.)]